MDQAERLRRELERDLREALVREEFELHYQPVFDASTKTVVAFEALVRWRHPTRGLIAPADFIAFAEESNLILSLGDWVLRQACATARGWPRARQYRGECLCQAVESGDLRPQRRQRARRRRPAPPTASSSRSPKRR